MKRFLILAASGRAIAQSACFAGYQFDVIDRFGDVDLKLTCENSKSSFFRTDNFCDAIDRLELRQYQGVVIGGGLEKELELLRRIESELPLVGCSAAQLVRVYSSSDLAARAQVNLPLGVTWPVTKVTLCSSDLNMPWLRKSLNRSGGGHVKRVDLAALADSRSETCVSNESWVYQQFIAGDSISAIFVSRSGGEQARHAGWIEPQTTAGAIRCSLVGCTHQLIGRQAWGSAPFAYCGSIGPIALTAQQEASISELGLAIAVEFSLTGIFGIDLIVNTAGIWPVDINPRIPASAELFEREMGCLNERSFSAFQTHVDAWRGRDGGTPLPLPGSSANRYWGKGIVYSQANREFVVERKSFDQLQSYFHQTGALSAIADVPDVGTVIRTGEPILTVFASGLSVLQTDRELNRMVHRIQAIFGQR